MELIHAGTYEKARQEVRRLKEGAEGAATVYKIVKSPYSGFDVIAIESDLYADMLPSQLVDGLPPFPGFGRPLRGDVGE